MDLLKTVRSKNLVRQFLVITLMILKDTALPKSIVPGECYPSKKSQQSLNHTMPLPVYTFMTIKS